MVVLTLTWTLTPDPWRNDITPWNRPQNTGFSQVLK